MTNAKFHSVLESLQLEAEFNHFNKDNFNDLFKTPVEFINV